MTYQSRGRSVIEAVIAVTFSSFLIGFITVLCIGNYLRAKRAMERQKQQRTDRSEEEDYTNTKDHDDESQSYCCSTNSSQYQRFLHKDKKKHHSSGSSYSSSSCNNFPSQQLHQIHSSHFAPPDDDLEQLLMEIEDERDIATSVAMSV